MPASREQLGRFAAIALGHIDREYPSKLDHVINDERDLLSPRALHPVFYGSFDWHSSVHGHWLLARVRRLCPSVVQSAAIRAAFDAHFTPSNVAAEVAYLRQPTRATFERMYGWSWLLKLACELRAGAASGTSDSSDFARWSRALEPLAAEFAARYMNFLPKATYPIRVGTHTNSAFGLIFAVEHARLTGHRELEALVVRKAREWYIADRACPAWEPDGSDFFSPALIEVECMRRVLPEPEFLGWLDGFLPRIALREPTTLFTPASVSDRTDGQITHLDGLNLSRAWCWRSLAVALPAGDPRRSVAEQASSVHLDAALPHIAGDYMGEHWLASFALLALTEPFESSLPTVTDVG